MVDTALIPFPLKIFLQLIITDSFYSQIFTALSASPPVSVVLVLHTNVKHIDSRCLALKTAVYEARAPFPLSFRWHLLIS